MEDITTAPLLGPRPRSGRWIGGVCTGIAHRWGWPVGRVRLAFVLSTSIVLLGPLIYLAAVLILPSEGGRGQAPGLRALVLAAQSVAAGVGVVVLIALSGALAVLGYGWIATVGAGVVLVAAAARWRLHVRPWVLLPLAALTLPAAGVALAGLRLQPRFRAVRLAPATLPVGATLHARNGLGVTHIDLRQTRLPTSGTVRIDIAAGTRQTVVALPHDTCMRVVVDRRVASRGWDHAVSLLGASANREPTVLFGTDMYGAGHASYGLPGRHGLTLAIHFSSVTGGLTVRDYPSDLDPWANEYWPNTFYELGRYPYKPVGNADPRELNTRAARQGARRAAGPCGFKARLVTAAGMSA